MRMTTKKKLVPEKKPVLESTIKNHVRKRLKELGAYYFMPVQFGVGNVTLDFLVCYRGKFYGIETKAPGRKLSPQQQNTVTKLINAGAGVFVIDSIEAADAIVFLL